MSLDSSEKIRIATEKKDAGDEAFKKGELQNALRNYHEALLYLNGLDKNAMESVTGSIDSPAVAEENKPKGPIDEMLEKIYANQSACHIKKGNWKRAIEAADKALHKNKDNRKAAFRKAKANAELGFIERAKKGLDELLKNPVDDNEKLTIENEIKRIIAADAERQRKHDKSMRGFLSRKKDAEFTDTATEADSAEVDEPAKETA